VQTCKEWEDVRRNERRKQDEACERKLERRVEREEERRRKEEGERNMQLRCWRSTCKITANEAGISADGVSRSSSMDFEPLDSKFGKNLSDAVAAAAAKSAAVGPAWWSACECIRSRFWSCE
jgi:hypothetical protein